jgi:hypothetical protein
MVCARYNDNFLSRRSNIFSSVILIPSSQWKSNEMIFIELVRHDEFIYSYYNIGMLHSYVVHRLIINKDIIN